MNSFSRRFPTAVRPATAALFPLLLAAAGHQEAVEAIAAARRLGMEVNRGNRGLLTLADGVLASRSGGRRQAAELLEAARGDLGVCPGWADIAACLVGEVLLADGWGQPDAWLRPDRLRDVGLEALANRCDRLLGAGPADRWGLTARERDVLGLVGQGLPNKEIASRLFVSPRTVEKHVESLLRKTGARSRAHLVAITSSG